MLDDIKKADVVLGGNSSVLVDAVTCGRPAGFVTNLDHGPGDLHQFVAHGLIYSVTDDAGNLKWEPEAMMSFYQRRQWLETLKFFANIEQEEDQVLTRCAKIMETLARLPGVH